MIQVQAIHRSAPMSDRKVRAVLRGIRNKESGKVLDQLSTLPYKSAKLVYRVIKSALANAQDRYQVDSNFYIVSAVADTGSFVKKFRPLARGRSQIIRRRTCHIKILLVSKDTTDNKI